MIGYAKLKIPINLSALQQEFNDLRRGDWLPHFNVNHYSGNWTVLALRSPGGLPNIIVPDAILGGDFIDTPLMKEFPSVKNLLQALECTIMSVRLLNLTAGSIIKQHRDFDMAFEKGEVRLHVPIFTNELVEFYVDEKIVAMQEGTCWYINANRPHRVSNRGLTDRIHLVIDCKVNDWIKQILDQAESVKIDESEDADLMMKIVSELRLQNSETSNSLANDILKTNTLL